MGGSDVGGADETSALGPLVVCVAVVSPLASAEPEPQPTKHALTHNGIADTRMVASERRT